jgi:hypothetical protein
LLASLITVVPNGLAAEDTPPPPCSAPEFRQFDFWVGEWDLTWPDSGRGANIITVELDSCVIEENFTTEGDSPFRGRSVSVYNPATERWSQTWVDNSGGYLDFVGAWRDSTMILSRTATDTSGISFMQRMVWFNIAADSLDWHWERSDDNGKTWRTLWAIHYQRKP